jgi:hypothetical protein
MRGGAETGSQEKADQGATWRSSVIKAEQADIFPQRESGGAQAQTLLFCLLLTWVRDPNQKPEGSGAQLVNHRPAACIENREKRMGQRRGKCQTSLSTVLGI